MIVQRSHLIAECIGAMLAVFYLGWRTLKGNRGKLVMKFGVVTVMVFVTMVCLSMIIVLPAWAFESFLALLFLLCLTTLFFFFLEVFQSLRKRKTRRRKAAEG